MESNKGVWLLGGILVIPFMLYGAGMIEAVYLIGAVIFVLFLSFLLVNFEAGFLTLILLRSSIDYLKNFTTSGAANLAAAISLALIVLGVFYVLYKKVNILKYADSGPFLVFLGLCGVSVLYTPAFEEGISDWLRLVSVFAVYVLTRILFTTKQKIRTLFIVTLLSSLAPIIVAAQQQITGRGLLLDGTQWRIVGTFLHPNAFASYLLILLIFCTSQLLERTPFVPRKVLMLLTAPAFVIFIFTFSRGAWLVFVVSMLMMGVLRYRKLLGYLPIVLGGAFLMIPAIKDRIINIVNPGYTHGRSGWEWRLDTWAQISEIMNAKNVWFGNGLAAVEKHFGLLTHNDYLRLFVEVGAIGLFSYIFFACVLLTKTWKDYNEVGSNIAKSFQIGLLVMVSGFLVREFADNTLRNTVMMIYFWIFVGIARNIADIYRIQAADGNAGITAAYEPAAPTLIDPAEELIASRRQHLLSKAAK